MKKQIVLFGAAALTILVIAAFIQGCTLVGLFVGKKIDKSMNRPDQGTYVTGWYLSSLDYYPQITLFLKGGTKFSGEYGGFFYNVTENSDSIPYLSVVNQGETKLVALGDIEQVYIKKDAGGAITGAFLGGVVDAGITLAVLPKLKSKPSHYTPPPSSGPPITSFGCCPYVYSYDGANYHFDSETFAGALAQGAQRIDWDNLDYLREHNGMYRFRLINELDEQDFVDELKLVVADHPKGTQVVPSVDGKLYTLAALQSPLGAKDLKGTDILSRLQPNDPYYWLTNPFGRNPEDDSQLRDGALLEFARPPGATSARLVFDVQNSEFSINAFVKMLSLRQPIGRLLRPTQSIS